MRGGRFVVQTDSRADLNRALMEEGSFEIAAFYFGVEKELLVHAGCSSSTGVAGPCLKSSFIYVHISTSESLRAGWGDFWIRS